MRLNRRWFISSSRRHLRCKLDEVNHDDKTIKPRRRLDVERGGTVSVARSVRAPIGVRSTGVTPTRWRVIRTVVARSVLIHFSVPIFLLTSSVRRGKESVNRKIRTEKWGDASSTKRSLWRKSADVIEVRAKDRSIEECSIESAGHEGTSRLREYESDSE